MAVSEFSMVLTTGLAVDTGNWRGTEQNMQVFVVVQPTFILVCTNRLSDRLSQYFYKRTFKTITMLIGQQHLAFVHRSSKCSAL